ncbi:MAG: hypothetical protein KatS3mg007_1506 [Thermoanaerobaculum sp.]|nr:MAG: hypothetical protein KatS3mg007_1506 [Thermoanaerobaculum sp.]
MTRSLDQKRAAFSWEKVHGKSKEYVNLAKAAPALVMSNGLMQTLAFFQSKGEGHHKELLQHVLEWLYERKILKASNFNTAMKEFSEMSSEQYMAATQEALAILQWIRQLAAAQANERKN